MTKIPGGRKRQEQALQQLYVQRAEPYHDDGTPYSQEMRDETEELIRSKEIMLGIRKKGS